MIKHGDLTKMQIFSLIETATVDESPRSYSTQTKQLVAFSVLALVYANRTKWAPTEIVSPTTRRELSEIAKSLQIEKVAHQTFVVHVRRMVRKFCEGAAHDNQVLRVRNAPDEHSALTALLELLASKNIFTAAHMRTWANSASMDPLDLSRLRKEVREW